MRNRLSHFHPQQSAGIRYTLADELANRPPVPRCLRKPRKLSIVERIAVFFAAISCGVIGGCSLYVAMEIAGMFS